MRAGAAAFALIAAAAAVPLGACAKPTPIERALSYMRQHRDAEATATLRAHLVTSPDDLDARKLLVRVLAASGDLAGAEAEVAELTKRMGEGDPEPFLELGHAFELAHKFEEALGAYDRAAEVAPSSPKGPREGGMRCARWGETEEARPRLEEAVRRGAHDAETFHALGLVKVHLQDLDGAEEAYTQGTRADPKDASSFLGLATVAVLRGDGAKALAAYDAILVRRPTYAPAELGRAWALAKLGRKDDAGRAVIRAEQLGAPANAVAKQRAALGLSSAP